jgi:DNA invertase Pin-like site-specific DNA recombinase
MAFLGYARVSTRDQDLASQNAALNEAGCTRIFSEKVSGKNADRPELNRMLDFLRDGDVVTVTRLDRLARNTRDLLGLAEQIQAKGAGLKSLAEPWADTTSPAGKMVLTVMAGVAEFERALIVARTSQGRIEAKARGVKFGRAPSLQPEQLSLAAKAVAQGETLKRVAIAFNVHRTTLSRSLARRRDG